MKATAAGGAEKTGGGNTDPPEATSRGRAASLPLSRALANARHVYANEVNGGRVHTDTRLVEGDQALLEDLARNDFSAAVAEARHEMFSNASAHITRVSVIRQGRQVVNAVWNENGTFVVAPRERAIALRGRSLGHLLVSVQDVVGYVKLVHKFTGDQVVVRGSSGQVRTSLSAARQAPLPRSGSLTIAGRRYRVGSFDVGGWPGETLSVYVLQPG
jgi:hypothetical protein